jgi:enoyl-CoA hydratase/carnithine racemase
VKSSDIIFERHGHVAVLKLNRREKLTAITVDMDSKMNEFSSTINNYSTIRAVVLTANGDKAFCAGSDSVA